MEGRRGAGTKTVSVQERNPGPLTLTQDLHMHCHPVGGGGKRMGWGTDCLCPRELVISGSLFCSPHSVQPSDTWAARNRWDVSGA